MFVLKHAANGRSDLFTDDQVVQARAAGYDEAVFRADGPSRAHARRAWDSERSGRDFAYTDEMDGEYGLEPLVAGELSAVVDLVRALVDRDEAALVAAGARDDGRDPYLWTAPYGRWERVDLEMPPGEPNHWSGHVVRSAATAVAVVVDLWTAQEGASDLSLELEVDLSGSDRLIRFKDLHVM